MIILDTNVVSEPFRPRPDPGVVAWMASEGDTAISAITVGEMMRGVVRLAPGRRRDRLASRIEGALVAHAGRIVSYDDRAARVYAGLHERRRVLGRPLAVEDGMIAATAFVHGATLATRNVRDFDDLGINLIDPWNLG